MKSGASPGLRLGAAAVGAVLGGLAWLLPAHAGGVITLENQSTRSIKAVAAGGSAVVEAGAAPVRLPVDSAEPVGVTVQVWWIDAPRELCRIFAPWDRTVVVTGERVINCRSQP